MTDHGQLTQSAAFLRFRVASSPVKQHCSWTQEEPVRRQSLRIISLVIQDLAHTTQTGFWLVDWCLVVSVMSQPGFIASYGDALSVFLGFSSEFNMGLSPQMKSTAGKPCMLVLEQWANSRSDLSSLQTHCEWTSMISKLQLHYVQSWSKRRHSVCLGTGVIEATP